MVIIRMNQNQNKIFRSFLFFIRAFEKDTIGKQLVKAVDSISSNLSEGYGRYHFNDSRQFCYYSRGSLYESLTWIKKSYNRKLISKRIY
ncbi:four helix bundle protein, partial [candidate division KSB1 bacterium]